MKGLSNGGLNLIGWLFPEPDWAARASQPAGWLQDGRGSTRGRRFFGPGRAFP